MAVADQRAPRERFRKYFPHAIILRTVSNTFHTEQSFSVVDRAHLLNDVFSLAEATQVKYATALQLTSYLKNEPDYVPWSVAQSKLNGLKNSLYYTELFAQYSKFGQSIVQGPYEQTSWTVGDNHLEK